MREISTHFCLVEPSAFSRESLLTGASLTLPAGAVKIACKGKVLFEQSPSTDDDGVVWNQTFRAVTDDERAMTYNGTRKMIGVYLTDGSIVYLGNADDAPLLTVTPYEAGMFSFSASFKALDPVVL